MKNIQERFFDYLVKRGYGLKTSRTASSSSFTGFIYNKNYIINRYFGDNIIMDFSNNNILIKKHFFTIVYSEFICFCRGKEALTDSKTYFEKRGKSKSEYIYFNLY